MHTKKRVPSARGVKPSSFLAEKGVLVTRSVKNRVGAEALPAPVVLESPALLPKEF
jgi:hypothetical protein